MNDALELRLRALGHELELPREPDLAPQVLERLSLTGTRPFPCRRSLALALALVVLAIATAFAVPQARTAILRLFHLGGATVVRVETLPPAVERAKAGGLGKPLSRAEAERQVGFRLLLPPFKGDGPDRVYVIGDSLATVIVGLAPGHRVLLSEFPSFSGFSLKKLTFGSTVESVRVNGAPGLWIAGGQHTLRYYDRELGIRSQTVLIHGNVLLWLEGGLTLRLEGEISKAKALSVARNTH